MSKPTLQSRLNYFLNLIFQGSEVREANAITREELGTGLPANIVSKEGYSLKKALDESSNAFYSRTSGRLRRNDAVEMNFNSPFNHRYGLKVDIQFRNKDTDETFNKSFTLGLYTLESQKDIKRIVESRANEIASQSSHYLNTKDALIEYSSFNVLSFIRYKNS